MKKPDKNILPLNGPWLFIRDTEDTAAYQDVLDKINGKENLPEMNIPVNWELAGLNDFSGTVWFIRKFDLQSDAPGLKTLVFNGVDYFTEIWINNVYAGRHEGYFQKFHFDVTENIKTKDNLLIVKVSSPKEEPGTVWPDRKKLIKGIFSHHDCRPGGWSHEYGQDKNTGGIWNGVFVEYGADVFIENIRVNTKLNDSMSHASAFINMSYYSLSSDPVSTKISVSVTAPSGDTTEHEVMREFLKYGEAAISLEIQKPELWWTWDTGEQNLYTVKITSPLFNDKQASFGIREVKLDDKKQFFLNGRRLFLRGTNVIPSQWLSDLTEEKITNQLSLIKEANVNIIRMHAHVNRHEYYDECDRMGILVWQDFALQWTYDESPEFTVNAVSQIKDMIRQRYNHPSIAFWCCHNEPGPQIDTLDNFLFDAAVSEDTNRIIRRASNYEEHPYDGWYWGKADHYEAAPMGPLVTEFGAQALPEKDSLAEIFQIDNLFPPDWEKWEYHNFQYEQTFMIARVEIGNSIDEFISFSQEYQAYLIRTAADSYRRRKNHGITGIFQFMFIDCWPSVSWS
ncbi:MAG: glycoside hydrolase family 2 protein, partial [Syntrophothermus sp.]